MKTRNKLFTLGLGLMLLAVIWTASAQQVPEVKFEKFTLPNGLQVILHEDHAVPVVSVNIWYHVGSKNEKRGRTGFAHLFEHLMFMGSENVPVGMFGKWLEAAGGYANGLTREDRSNYYEDVPSNALELALFLESDRMGTLLKAIDQEKLDTQRSVVQNERRQNWDNQPYGRVGEILLEALYPYNHPYSGSILGSMDDLSAATLEDVREFFTRYYAPNNASLCIAGDIDPAAVRSLVERYFGSIPPGPPLERIETWVPSLDSPVVVDMKDNVSLPRLAMAWHSSPAYAEGEADLNILSSILSDGKDSRLYKRLVYELQIAQDVNAFNYAKEISGMFQVVATARPGHSLADLQKVIDEELTRIAQSGPTAEEVRTAVINYEASFIRRLEPVGGFGGRADLLNRYNVLVGRPDYLREDLGRYFRVTPETVKRAALRTLDPQKRVVVNVEPAGDLKADAPQALDRTRKPAHGPQPQFNLPAFEQRTLSNGLRVVVAEKQSLPLVEMTLLVDAGWSAGPAGRSGIPLLAADMLDEGSASRSAVEISAALKAIGTELRTSSYYDHSSVSLNFLKKHMDASLDIFADIVLRPSFPEEELARKKQEYLALILQQKRQPFHFGIISFFRTLYGPDHPYGQPYTGTGDEASVQAVSRQDLVDHYRAFFVPANSVLIAVGDITADELVPALEESLAGWKGREAPAKAIPEPRSPEATTFYLIDKPGASQSMIVAGHLGLKRDAADYYAFEVMNTILGGKFTSRLNMNLREDKGYTYGVQSMNVTLRSTGPFMAFTMVQTEVTKESVAEIVKEMKSLGTDRPVGRDELEEAKKNITLGYPREFETLGGIADKLLEIMAFGLPADSLARYIPCIEAVSEADVTQAARAHVRPDAMIVLIVGDVSKIETGIRELGLGEVRHLDADGNPVKD